MIILLTVPRTVSTAFEASMMARGDLEVLHEPWASGWALREGREETLAQQPASEIAQNPSYTSIKKWIYQTANAGKKVFVKDMLYAVLPDLLSDEELLADERVEIAFLVRDPAKSLDSYGRKAMELKEKNTVMEDLARSYPYKQMLALVERLRQVRGREPVVVDAGKLLEDPQGTMQRFCAACKLDFKPEALSWKQGMRKEWKKFSPWHEEVAGSSGFKKEEAEPHSRFALIREDWRPGLENVYQDVLPSYTQLKSQSL